MINISPGNISEEMNQIEIYLTSCHGQILEPEFHLGNMFTRVNYPPFGPDLNRSRRILGPCLIRAGLSLSASASHDIWLCFDFPPLRGSVLMRENKKCKGDSYAKEVKKEKSRFSLRKWTRTPKL